MNKIVHGLSEVQLPNLMRKTRTNRSASGKGFRNVRSNKNCYRSSFLPQTIPEWNNLPDKIRNAPSLKNLVNRSNQHQGSCPIQSLLLTNRLLTFPVLDNQFLVISTVTFSFRFRFGIPYFFRISNTRFNLASWTLVGIFRPSRCPTCSLTSFQNASVVLWDPFDQIFRR